MVTQKRSPIRVSTRVSNYQSGFSTVELMMAVGIGLVSVTILAAVLKMSGKLGKDAMSSVGGSSISATVGTNFPTFSQQARASAQFMHLPIARNCSGLSTPCVRVFNSKTGSFKSAGSVLGSASFSSLEFYRDNSGTLLSNDPQFKLAKRTSNSGTAFYTDSPTVDLSAVTAANELHATWPLVDQNSQPFPMLVQPLTVRFEVPGYTATSSASVGSSLFLKLRSGSIDNSVIDQLNGQLMVFYDSGNPQVYAIQAVTAAHLCRDVKEDCKIAAGSANASDVTDNDVLIRLALPDSNMNALLPNANALGDLSSWPAEVATIPFFPNLSANVQESSVTYFAGSQFDPRRLLHYFHSSGVVGSLNAAPVSLLSFKLVNSGNQVSLVRDLYQYGASPDSHRVAIVPVVDGPVMFTHKIGSPNLKLVLFSDDKRSPTAETTELSGIKVAFQGTMMSSNISLTTMDRRTVNYPKNCEMTYSAQGYCGDGDVQNYYSAHPNEDYGHGHSNFKLVLGYWVEPATGASSVQMPTADNWYAIGYDDLGLDSNKLGIKQINSNVLASSSNLIKQEVERLVSLGQYMPDKDSAGNPVNMKLYAATMLCSDWQDNAGTLTDPVSDTFSTTAQACDSPLTLSSGGVSLYSATDTGIAACDGLSIPSPSPGSITYSDTSASCKATVVKPVYSGDPCPTYSATCPGGSVTYTTFSPGGGTGAPSAICSATITCPKTPDPTVTTLPTCPTDTPPTCPATTLPGTGSVTYTYAFDPVTGAASCVKHDVCPLPGGGGGGGGSCFVAGTKVTMADGSQKAIEDVQVGDHTLAYNEMTGKTYAEEVTKALHHEERVQKLFHVTLEDGRKFTSNEIHAIFIVEKNGYVQVQNVFPEFLIGNPVSMLDESGRAVRIVSMETETKSVPLYNLHVKGLAEFRALPTQPSGVGHNYFVEGLLVHNLKPVGGP